MFKFLSKPKNQVNLKKVMKTYNMNQKTLRIKFRKNKTKSIGLTTSKSNYSNNAPKQGMQATINLK